MSNMVDYCNNTISTTIELPFSALKCKRCKNEFAVINSSAYHKTICFCPYCGQSRESKRRSIKNEED